MDFKFIFFCIPFPITDNYILFRSMYFAFGQFCKFVCKIFFASLTNKQVNIHTILISIVFYNIVSFLRR